MSKFLLILVSSSLVIVSSVYQDNLHVYILLLNHGLKSTRTHRVKKI